MGYIKVVRDAAYEERDNSTIMAGDIDFLLKLLFFLRLTPKDSMEVGRGGFGGVGLQALSGGNLPDV